MLAANEAVARSFHERNEDTLWRIHDAPDRARLEEFAVLAAELRHRDRRRRRAHAAGAQAGARPAEGPPGREGAVVPAAALAQAGDLRRRQPRALRAGVDRLPALHLADPPLSRSDRAPAAQDAGWPGRASRRAASSRRRSRRVPDRAALQKMAADSSFSERSGDGGRARGDRSLPRVLPARSHRRRVRRRRSRAWRASACSSSSTSRSSRGWCASRRCPTTTTSSTSRRCRLVGRRSGRTFALGDTRQGRGAVGQRRAPQGRLRAGRAPRARTHGRAATATAGAAKSGRGESAGARRATRARRSGTAPEGAAARRPGKRRD